MSMDWEYENEEEYCSECGEPNGDHSPDCCYYNGE